MSFWNKLKGHAGAQFLDVIQWMEDDHETLVYRYPVFNQAI
jgi:membrane protease subunit (stomatin/prohibitin family)